MRFEDMHRWTKDELLAYDYASMRKQDERGKVSIAVQKAVEKAVKETETKKEIEIALRGIQAGYPIEMIKTLTGLTDEQIEDLRKSAN